MNGFDYQIINDINSSGFFNKMYPYELNSITEGNIFENNFYPKFFKYSSHTKKKSKNISINFNKDGFVKNYNIIPQPEDIFINNFDNIKNDKFFIDPVSQLFQYFLYQSSSDRLIIDGRRIYSLKSKNVKPKKFDKTDSINFKGEALGLKITFPYYLSLWKKSDDDKNAMDYVKFYYSMIDNTNVPIQIIIKTKNLKVFLDLSSYSIIN